MKEIHYIYVFKDSLGKILYVGKTLNPKKRESMHRGAGKSKIKSRIKNCEFKIIRKCNARNVFKIEAKLIRLFKEKGEAILNRSSGVPNMPSKIIYSDKRILWKERGIIFNSIAEAARFLRSTSHIVSAHIRSEDDIIYCAIGERSYFKKGVSLKYLK